jgi:hypothetical protein
VGYYSLFLRAFNSNCPTNFIDSSTLVITITDSCFASTINSVPIVPNLYTYDIWSGIALNMFNVAWT